MIQTSYISTFLTYLHLFLITCSSQESEKPMLWAERLKCWGWQNSLSELFVSCRSQVFVMFSIVSLQRASVSTVKVGGEVETSASKSSIRRFVITEKAPTRAFSWLKAPTSAFTFKTLLRNYAKRALTPRSLNVKLGPRCKSQKGQSGWLA